MDNIDFSKIYSPSKIKTFENCPQQYQFEYLHPIYKSLKNKLKKLPHNIWSFYTVGHAVHDAITLFYYLPLTQRTQNNLLLRLRQTWRSEAMPNKKMPLGKWGGFKTIDEEREAYREAQNMLKNFYTICDKNPDILFLPTNDFRKSIEDYKNLIVHLNKDYDISGKFDLIIKTDNKKLHIIDFKTGKSEEKDDFQLRFYRVLAEKRFNIPVDKVSFYYLRKGDKVDFDMNLINIDYAKNGILAKIEEIVSIATFNTRPSKLCRYCVLKTYCPGKEEVNKILQNTKENEYPDDLPF